MAAPFGLRDFVLHVAGLLDIVLGSFVFSKNPKSSRNIAFFIFALFVAAWTFFVDYFLLAESFQWAYFWIHAVAVSITGIAAGIHYVVLSFTYDNLNSKMKQILFFYSLVFFVFFSCFIPGFYVKDIIYHSWGKENVLGLGYYVVYAIFAALVIAAFLILWSNYRRAVGEHKLQLRYLLYSTAFAFSFGSYFNWLLVLFGIYKYIWVGPLSSFILVAITAYSITRHHLLDIEVVIKKTAFYSILTALLTGLFVSLIVISQHLFSQMTGSTSLIATVIGSFIIALLFQPIREIVQRGVDKVFFHARYNYQTILSRYSQMLKKPMENLDRFARIAPYLIRKSMRLSSVSLMVFDSKERRCLIRSAAGKISRQLVGSSLPMDSPLIEELLRRRGEICRDEKDLPLKAAEEMDWLKADLIIPCISESKSFSHPTLLAAVNLGKKLSDEAFSVEDITFLKIMANQAATAIENVALYEENLKAEKQLLLADKLSSMGRVAAGLAHEIKNPLTAIKGMTQALERNPGDQETIKDFNAIIPKEVDRLTRLVENLSNLGKTPKFQIAKTNINTLIENNLKLFESRCRKQGINLVKELGPVPEIETDGERLTQVFTNLILNAIQAMPDGGTLTIQTKQQTNITIEISDTGHGIPEDKIKDIFEPFFTTKEEGTGLGLAITHKIIKDLGGEISVESKVGEGTKFRITLPCP